MRKNSKNAVLNQEEVAPLSLDELVYLGAVERVKFALEKERMDFLESKKSFRLEDGRLGFVGNGYGKERSLLTPVGELKLQVPRVENRGITGKDGEIEEFESAIAPRYRRKSMTIEETIPLLYLHGLSTNDFVPALRKMFGSKANGLSASSISRMLDTWKDELKAWKKRSLKDKEYCYIWVDGIYFGSRNSSEDICVLVLVGATKAGKKELITIETGYRESTESWLSLLRKVKACGLKVPKLFIGDGALGFWAASKQVYPEAEGQRCWVHKIANVLDKIHKSQQKQAKAMLQAIYMSPSKKEALVEWDRFVSTYEDKYTKAVECLLKDKNRMLTFYNYPAAHWIHIRTTNPIESTFATARLRSVKTRGNWAGDRTEMMVFKLLEKASSRWKRLHKHKEVEKVMQGVKYVDGLELAA